MSSPLKQECSAFCQQETGFSLKFVITSLKLSNHDEGNGFEDILVAITFDGHVIKIEKFEENDEGEIKLLGRGLDLRLSPEQFSEKLRFCPIMLSLSRGCIEMGTLKLEISDCFIDAVKCEEFSSEKCETDLKFIKDGQENAIMNLIVHVSREDDENLFKGLKKPKKKEIKLADEISNVSTNCSTMTLSYSSDCGPLNHAESEFRTTTDSFHPASSSRSKSTRSKCLSDIATSLDIRDYSDNQQTFCNKCRHFSISGVTCDNKNLIASLPESPLKSPCKVPSFVTSTGNCKKSVNRICSECFEDLSVIPDGAPCPKCAFHAQLQRKLISLKSKKTKSQENEKIRGCIKSILEEIFLEEKDRLVKDWKRLTRKPKKKAKKVLQVERRNSPYSTSLDMNSKPR